MSAHQGPGQPQMSMNPMLNRGMQMNHLLNMQQQQQDQSMDRLSSIRQRLVVVLFLSLYLAISLSSMMHSDMQQEDQPMDSLSSIRQRLVVVLFLSLYLTISLSLP